MAHVRKLIRHAVKARLNGLPITGERVEMGRTRPLGAEHEPTLLIYTSEEISGFAIEGNPGDSDEFGRDLQLLVDGRVTAADSPDDLLDDIAEEVEARMRQGFELDGLAFSTELVRTVSDVKAEGKNHIGSVRMEFRVRPSEED